MKKAYPLERLVQANCIKHIRKIDPKCWVISNTQSKSKKHAYKRKLDFEEGFVKGQPDIIINKIVYSPQNKRYYTGLCLELKRGNTKIFSNKRVFEGYESNAILNQKRYFENYATRHFCAFAVGLEEAKDIINLFFSFNPVK